MISTEKGSFVPHAANGGQALYRKWSRRISSLGSVLKLYWPAMLCMLGMLAFFLWYEYRVRFLKQSYYYHVPGYEFWMIGLFFTYFVVRMQLACMPVIVALPDFEELRWPSLRTTAITTAEMFVAIVVHTVRHNVLVLGLLTLLGLIIWAEIDNASGGTTWWAWHPIDFVYAAIGISLVGFSLSGLGYITSMIRERPIAVIGGVFAPIILLILVGIGMFVASIQNYYLNGMDGWLYLVDILTMLVAPEGYYLSGLDSGDVRFPSGAEMGMGSFTGIEALISFAIWGIVWIVLTRKRR